MKRRRERYEYVDTDDFFAITHRGWRLRCCDCALVHTIDARVNESGRIEVRIRRDNRATAASRRHGKDLPFTRPKRKRKE